MDLILARNWCFQIDRQVQRIDHQPDPRISDMARWISRINCGQPGTLGEDTNHCYFCQKEAGVDYFRSTDAR
jgi:hypothetical protein